MFLLCILLIIPGTFSLLISSERNEFCFLQQGKKRLSMLDKFWAVSNGTNVFYFNLCQELPKSFCGKGVAGCLKNSHSDDIFYIRKDISNVTLRNTVVLFESTSNCSSDPSRKMKVMVNFYCSEPLNDTPQLIKRNDCEYDVTVLAPQGLECKYPQCTTNIDGHLLDLRPLKGIYPVHSEDTDFSIALCQTNAYCNATDITACKLSGNTPEPLASKSGEMLLFHEEENGIIIRSSYKGSSDFSKKLFEIEVRCSWNKTLPDIYYIKPMTQGKKYKFYMETVYACIKTPPHCEITDLENNNFVYNLTTLYKKSGHWEVKGVPDSRILLNVCGPLKLNDVDNICSKSFSQVCKREKENFVNLGSIQQKFSLLNDGISLKFEAGGICRQDGTQYNTAIKFRCSKLEEGPKYLSSNNCDIHLSWNTPAACTVLQKNISCDIPRGKPQNCIFHMEGYKYNFSHLSKIDHYTIHDDNKIDYMLNICEPVTDPDIPCTNEDMVVIKYVDEIDQKKKFKFLGKMTEMSVVGDKIAIKMKSGSYCKNHPYASTIYLACSDKNEYPRLLNKTDCYYEFLFRTRAACPKPLEAIKRCTFDLPHNNHTLMLKNLEQPSIKFNISGSLYLFDICFENKQLCRKEEHCIYVPSKKTIFSFENKMYLDFVLTKECVSPEDFNRTLMELICDPITSNEHYKLIGIKNCILYMSLATNLVCSQKQIVWPLLNLPHVNKTDYIISEASVSDKTSTIISNPDTGYSFDIGQYNIHVQNISNKQVAFFYANNSVVVNYITNRQCIDDVQNRYQYQIIMYCKQEGVQENHFTTQDLPCVETYTLTIAEACKLLERNILKTASTAEIAGSVIGALLIIIALSIFYFYIYKQRRRRGYNQYLKEGDL